MPKVVLSKALQEKEEKRRMILGILEKYRFVCGFASWEQAAPRCKITSATLYRRIKTPEDFTIAELRNMISGLKIPVEEIRPYIC